MAELLNKFEPNIERITLVPSDGGRFEITVNDQLVYSKLRIGRHAEQGEVAQAIHKLLEEG